MYRSASSNAPIRRFEIDFLSDTLTKPSAGMRKAMAEAEVGDDVYGEDPTVRVLEERVALMMGKEAGLFVPSGTQSNLIALMAHCGRGEEFITGTSYHSYLLESGGAAAVGSIMPCPLPVDENGALLPGDVRAAIKPDNTWFVKTRLLALENTVNGQVQNPKRIAQLCTVARENGLSLHLDGARIWNASVQSETPLADLAAPFDSVSSCLSKGLGAPVGSVLCGSHEFIYQAGRVRKMLGGGMRQAGILAAACLYALDHNLPKLAQDHANAAALADGLSGIDRLTLHRGDTNMLFLGADPKDRESLVAHLENQGIRVGPPAAKIRMVTHMDISPTDIKTTIRAIREFYNA